MARQPKPAEAAPAPVLEAFVELSTGRIHRVFPAQAAELDRTKYRPATPRDLAVAGVA